MLLSEFFRSTGASSLTISLQGSSVSTSHGRGFLPSLGKMSAPSVGVSRSMVLHRRCHGMYMRSRLTELEITLKLKVNRKQYDVPVVSTVVSCTARVYAAN